MITVKFYGTVRSASGVPEAKLGLDGACVADVLNALGETYGPALQAVLFDADHGLARSVQLLVNGKHLSWDTVMSQPLADGDVLYIMPVVAGG